jgi:ADP-ribosylation factor GTPase-activating protein 2/3
MGWRDVDSTSFRYPHEVVITDIPAGTPSDGSGTPAGDQDDDFFSSWDKPSIKRPSNPPSRTGTPPVVSRTSSPFLNAGAGANGSRSKSPLSATEEKVSSPAPTAIRANTAARKTTTTGAAKKGSILGAKKVPKLGAKKVVASDIDFDEMERKAKEEAERIEKLGYDPEAEQAEAKAASTPAITSPTPISPSRAGFGATGKTHERNSSDVERLGMGMSKLGFGQVSKPAAPKKLGFGAVAPAKSKADGMFRLPNWCRVMILIIK